MNALDVVPTSHKNGAVSGAGKARLAPANVLQPLTLRSMFWRPHYSADPAWLEHVPFAFWLVEAQRPRLVVEVGSGSPVLYFSFCQAIERLELESSCVRIFGQGQAGAEEACAYNAAQYSAFSRLETGDLRAAHHQFEDGSIDLLHVAAAADMLSSEDLAEWMPKLSPRGVLVTHGAAERQTPVPVGRMAPNPWRVHPTFEFAHGNGLTLVAVGAEPPELVKLLCVALGNLQAKRTLQDVFSRLGRACVDSHAVTEEKAASLRLSESVEECQRRIHALQNELRQAELGLQSRSRELEAAQHKLGGQAEQRAAERGQLSEKITLLQEVRVDLKKQIEALQARADSAAASLLARAEQVGRLEQTVALRDARINEIEASLGQRDVAIAALQARADSASASVLKHAEQIGHLQQTLALRDARIDEIESLLGQRDATIAALEARAGSLEHAANEKDAECVALIQARETLGQKASQLEETIRGLEKLLQESEADRKAMREERIAGERLVHELQADARQAAARLDITHEELADLTRFLIEAERQATAVAEERDLMARKATAYEMRLRLMQGRIAAMQKLMDRMAGTADGGAPGMAPNEGATPEDPCSVILRSGLFDAEWYLHRYPDIAAAGADPLQHYLRHGATEFRDPGPYFNTAAYLAANGGSIPEAANPLLHYLASETDGTFSDARLEGAKTP